MTEQAYHARGAGRDLGKRIELFISRDMGINPGDGITQRTMFDSLREAIERWEKVREPGADTGTTPSRDCVWTVEQNGAVHSVHSTYESAFKEEGENLRIGGPWQVLPWRAIERGTTPPEGLDWPECEDFYNLMQQYRHAAVSVPALVLDRYEAIKKWLRETRAATQRAAVEQGRETHEALIKGIVQATLELACLRNNLCYEDGPPIVVEQCAELVKDAWDAMRGIDTCSEEPSKELVAIREALAAAPDHAREGALLREAAKEYIEALLAMLNVYKLGDTRNGGTKADRLKSARIGWERALADGKEGGE